MRVSSTMMVTAALSSAATLGLTLLAVTFVQNGNRDQGLTPAQRSDVARLVKEQVRDDLDLVSKTTRGQGLTEAQRADVARVLKEELHQHPEILQAFLAELIKKRLPAVATPAAPAAPAPVDKSALVRSNAPAIFASAHQVTLGNPDGDVTMVEFFDYNCGFCKRALPDMVDLMKADPRLKVVLKEFPILSPGSLEAAKVAIAVRMQDKGGARYLAFHQKLLSGQGPANKANALAVAQSLGFDAARIEQDLESDEVKQTLEESQRLARTLGINGTPSYVIGDTVVVGAVGIAALTDKVRTARR